METLETGSTSTSNVKPWEMVWNEAATSVRNVIEEAKGSVKEALKPWEMYWGPPKAGASPVPPAPVKRSAVQPKAEKPTEAPYSFETVFSALIKQESQGKHFDASGSLTASPVGAKGVTQVMPKTGRDPGYGVKPLADNTEEEYKRFGRDYLTALLKEFDNDYEKALAAYNAGVGNVKRAIAKGQEDWKDHLPKKKETLPYIDKILGKKK